MKNLKIYLDKEVIMLVLKLIMNILNLLFILGAICVLWYVCYSFVIHIRQPTNMEVLIILALLID